MNSKPPFFPNRDDGMSCMSAVYRSVIAHFTGVVPSWEDIDSLTGYQKSIAAWTLKPLTTLALDG